VVGGGVSGLTCGAVLAGLGFEVEVRARELAPQTTSAVAAALWYPYRAGPPEAVERWSRASYAAFCELACDPCTGVFVRPGIELLPEPGGEDSWRHDLLGLRRARASELRPGYRYGWVFETPIVEMPVYLEWLTARLVARGGRLVQAEVHSLEDVAAECELVVHCAGLGARELARDATVVPVRGQVLRVERCGLTSFTLDDHNPAGLTYVVPRSHDCVLGGSAHEGRDELSLDEREAHQILTRCRRLEPRLERAAVLGVGIGVRPCRPEVRLEAELLGRVPVIHDYGHGGAGVTLSWGCARDVGRFAAQAFPELAPEEARA
jgi:D-amino-acid oxidase